MRYLIIAGEASGDLHGANLMKSLKERDPEADFLFFGGERMLSVGGIMLKHYRDMAYMGAIDVLRNLRKIDRNFRLCREALLKHHPDCLILIDYPGFNLKMAGFARKNHLPVFYYILPKVWAWKAWRIKKLKSGVDSLISVFPFEPEFFRKHGVEVQYVGNPLLDSLAAEEGKFRSRLRFLEENHLPQRPLVALLPGSRSQEIRWMLPVMTRLAGAFPDFQFVVSGTVAVDPLLYARFTDDPSLPVLYGQTYELLHHAHAAVVTSGTATLETALLHVPQVVLYKMAGGKIGWRLFRYFFLKVKYVSLPNLVHGSEIVREFVMDEMKFEKIKPEVEKLLKDDEYRLQILNKYRQVEARMGGTGASRRAADLMREFLVKK